MFLVLIKIDEFFERLTLKLLSMPNYLFRCLYVCISVFLVDKFISIQFWVDVKQPLYRLYLQKMNPQISKITFVRVFGRTLDKKNKVSNNLN